MKKSNKFFLTPIKSIREECKYCTVGGNKEIKKCQIIKSPLWGYRMGKRPTSDMLSVLSDYYDEVKKEKFIFTPIKAIRSNCSDCSYGPRDIRNCNIKYCSLWLYRLGKRPNDEMLKELKKYFDNERPYLG